MLICGVLPNHETVNTDLRSNFAHYSRSFYTHRLPRNPIAKLCLRQMRAGDVPLFVTRQISQSMSHTLFSTTNYFLQHCKLYSKQILILLAPIYEKQPNSAGAPHHICLNVSQILDHYDCKSLVILVSVGKISNFFHKQLFYKKYKTNLLFINFLASLDYSEILSDVSSSLFKIVGNVVLFGGNLKFIL